MLINHALLTRRDQLNAFTDHLAARCRIAPKTVTLRDGSQVDVKCEIGEGMSVMFLTPDWSKTWNADGSSPISWELDIIKF
jgi:hypothetical protein